MKTAVSALKMAVCAFALVGMVVLSGCGGGGGGGSSNPKALVGKWVNVNARDGDGSEVEFLSDGTLIFNMSERGSWKVVDKRLLMTMKGIMGGGESGNLPPADYNLSGYKLTLVSNGDTLTVVKKEKLEDYKAKQAAENAKQEAKKAKQAAAAEAEKAKQIAAAKRAMEQLPKFTDSRDNNVYKKVTIGTQTWMAENLNYAAEGSKCYENNESNCAKYGRMYNWATAMGGSLSSSLSPSGVQGVCPAGWHIPSDAEWTTLTDFVGGASTAGTKLKSTSGWYKNGNGTDQYGFSALPGGIDHSGGQFDLAGYNGYWWSATGTDKGYALFRYMHNNENVTWSNNYDTNLFSVRCVQD
jgi:uncharacterized protein (TIGR02145 family)